MAYRQRKQPSRKRLYISIAAVAAAVILGGFVLFNVLRSDSQVTPAATGPQTKGETSASSTSKSGSAAGTTAGSSANQDKSNPTGGSTNATLIAPTGTFVSNHHPNLGGQPAPNKMSSNCTTTPGASCQISFTLGSTTKSLPSKTTDAEGSAYWENWTLQSIGLTQGNWAVKATATLGDKTSSATDGQELVVAP